MLLANLLQVQCDCFIYLTFILKYMGIRRTVLIVAMLNLIYFVIEFYYGRKFNSVSLIGDSVDFLEDASVNILIAFAIGWSLRKRKYASYALALLLLVPGIAFLWNAIHQFLSPEVPEAAVPTPKEPI